MRHRTSGRVVGLAASLIVMVSMAGRAQQSASELFERARLLEENGRNLNRAVEIYEQVVALAKADRALAASAQLRIALARERQGKPEARQVFAKVAEDYKDQPAAAIARAKLAATGTASRRQELAPRRVLDGAWAQMFDISSDGRFTVGPERRGYSAFDIVLRNVATGQITTLVPGSDGASGFQARISNDGRRVAYNWTGGGGDQLRVIETSPGASPSVIAAPPHSRIAPVDWTPDGATLLVVLRRYDNSEYSQEISRELAWLSLETRSLRTIKTVDPLQADFLTSRLSPDGQYIAYVVRLNPQSGDEYIYVVDANGQNDAPVVSAAGYRDYPVWSADGTRLLFEGTLNDTGQYTGQTALWTVPVQNGRAAGEPSVVLPDFPGIPLGMTASGVFYYRRSSPNVNYEFVLNRRPSASEQVLKFPGMHASWHQNLVAFRGEARDAPLIIRNIETGQERSFRLPGLRLRCAETCPVYWLPDGSGVIVGVRSEGETQASAAFYLVNASTGSYSRLFDRDFKGRTRTNVAAVSPDGRTMYLGVRATATSQVSGVVAVDVATGEERDVITFVPGTGQSGDFGIAVSPDGRTLAVTAWIKANEEAHIFTIDVNGANYREIVSSFAAGWLADKTRWTRDGRGLVFVTFDAGRDWRIMRVPIEGGQPEFDGLDHRAMAALIPDLRMAPGNFNNFELSPDGGRIAASTWTLGKHELWTLDGLLSVLNSR